MQPTPGLLTAGKIAGAAGGTAVSAASLASIGPSFAASGALAAIPIAGIFASIGGMIAGLIGAHHAQAVQAQATAICSAVPQAQQILQAIDAQLASGSIAPAQASQLYSQIGSQFSAAMKNGTSYKRGDALWGFDQAMQAVLYARNLDLKAGVLTGGAALSAASDGSPGASPISRGSSSLPTWLPLAALAAGAAYLLAA